jgi:hypothetical protein
MTPHEILKAVAAMPEEDWITIQCGITEMSATRFSPEEIAEINKALDEADAEFERGEGLSNAEARKLLGLK